MRPEMQLRLIYEQPASRTAPAALKWIIELAAYGAGGETMARPLTWMSVQSAEQYLADHMRR